MLVTFTNTTSQPIYVHTLQKALAATGASGAVVTTRRTPADLDRDQTLKANVVGGYITLGFTLETGDTAALGASSAGMASYSNATRPAASTVPAFVPIWNTSDNAPNWSDGTNWRDASGIIT